MTDVTQYLLDRRYGYHYHKSKYGVDKSGSVDAHKYSNDRAGRLGPTLFPGDTSAEDMPAETPDCAPIPPVIPASPAASSGRTLCDRRQASFEEAAGAEAEHWLGCG